jgi:hypothetical protein
MPETGGAGGMKKPKGHEMRSFLIAASALVAVLIVAIVIITTVNAVKTLDQEQAKAKQKDVDNVINMAKGTATSLKEVEKDPRMLQFISPEMIKSATSGENIKPFMDSTIFITRAVGSAEYAAYITDGKVYAIAPRMGFSMDGIEVPTEIPDSGYTILDELGGQPGYFLQIFSVNNYPGLGPNQFSISVLDRTSQMKAIDDYYATERSNLIKKQLLIGLIGLVLALAVCLIGLRLLTRHYITGPIDELKHMSRELMEGNLDTEVVVDEKSDFADLQRLLQSGKLLLGKMDEME